MTSEGKASKKKKDLKQLYQHWFPSNKEKCLILDLQKPVPEQLTDISYIQPIIAAYNPYLIYFVRHLLNLIEPSIPNSVAERVYKLAELISTPEKFSPTASTVYTADDLKPPSEHEEDIEITDVIQPEQVDVTQQKDNQDIAITGIWKLAPSNHNWSSCPIGILPWQIDNDDIMMETNK